MDSFQPVTYARDAVVATAALFGLFALMHSGVPGLVIPGYLLVVGFDRIEVLVGSAGANYQLLFYTYLAGLGLLAAGAAQGFRSADTDAPAWRLGLASALGLIGAMSLLFALAVLPTVDGLTHEALAPVLITGSVALACFALAAWLVGVLPVTGDIDPAN